MLTTYRRHRAGCKFSARRNARCFCPIWVQGVLDGKPIRQSLSLTNWEAAQRRVRDMEIHGENRSANLKEAAEKFIADCEASSFTEAMVKKYQYVCDELVEFFGAVELRGIFHVSDRFLGDTYDDRTVFISLRSFGGGGFRSIECSKQ